MCQLKSLEGCCAFQCPLLWQGKRETGARVPECYLDAEVGQIYVIYLVLNLRYLCLSYSFIGVDLRVLDRV